MNILMLTPYPPVLNVHGGGMRMFHNIRILAGQHNVRVISFVETPADCERLRTLTMCESVSAIPRRGWQEAPSSSLPAPMHEFNTPEMHAAVKRAFQDSAIDVLQCEYSQMAQYWRRDTFTILTQHELASAAAYESFQDERHLIRKIRRFAHWKALLRYDRSSAERFDRVVTMTARDAGFLKSHTKGDIRDIPIGIDTDAYTPVREDAGPLPEVLFLGNFRHLPNLQAARFLIDEVAPRLPDLRFVIAGPNLKTVKVPANVTLAGYVKSTQAFHRGCNTIAVAPLFSGNGQRVKMLEAFAMGCPVVSTPRGVEGFPVTHEKECLLASTVDEFVSRIRQLAELPGLRRELGTAARRLMEKEFEWHQIAPRLLSLVRDRSTGEARTDISSCAARINGTRFLGIPNPESPKPRLLPIGLRTAMVRQEENGTFVEASEGITSFIASFIHPAPSLGLELSAELQFRAPHSTPQFETGCWLNEPFESIHCAVDEKKELVLALVRGDGNLAVARPLTVQALGENAQGVLVRATLYTRSGNYPDGAGFYEHFDFQLSRDGKGWLCRNIRKPA